MAGAMHPPFSRFLPEENEKTGRARSKRVKEVRGTRGPRENPAKRFSWGEEEQTERSEACPKGGIHVVQFVPTRARLNDRRSRNDFPRDFRLSGGLSIDELTSYSFRWRYPVVESATQNPKAPSLRELSPPEAVTEGVPP